MTKKKYHYTQTCWICGQKIYGTKISVSAHIQNCGKGSKKYSDLPTVKGEAK